MDIEQLEKLMKLMANYEMRRLVLKEKGGEIELERGSFAPASVESAPVYRESKEEKKQAPATHKEEGKLITSPMIGTFYASPSPENPTFVKIGDRIDEKKVVCIIEAMKVMNEVKAGIKGKVVEVFVKNGAPVEFGTPLFRVTAE